jgi:hypothetical protein
LAKGWDVIGVDIDFQGNFPYPAAGFIRCDVREFSAVRGLAAGLRPQVIVASPPCDEFSRFMMPWTRARNPPQPDLTVVEACYRIAREYGCPIVLENVREAQRWLGTAKAHVGAFYLWGDVPAILPAVRIRKKESLSSTEKLKRAEVPLELAMWIAECFAADSADIISTPAAASMAAQTAMARDCR